MTLIDIMANINIELCWIEMNWIKDKLAKNGDSGPDRAFHNHHTL